MFVAGAHVGAAFPLHTLQQLAAVQLQPDQNVEGANHNHGPHEEHEAGHLERVLEDFVFYLQRRRWRAFVSQKSHHVH